MKTNLKFLPSWLLLGLLLLLLAGGAGAQTAFVNQPSFTGTAGTTATGYALTTGGTLQKINGSGTDAVVLDGAGGLYDSGGSNGWALYAASQSPAQVQYDVQADFTPKTVSLTYFGLASHVTSGGGIGSGFFGEYNNGAWKINKAYNNAIVSVTSAITAGVTYRTLLRTRTTPATPATTVDLYLYVQRLSDNLWLQTDGTYSIGTGPALTQLGYPTTNASFSSAGQACIWLWPGATDTTTTGVHVTNFVATNIIPPITIPVNSAAAYFSPAAWTGDTGRGGSVYRQSWQSGSYFRYYFTSNTNIATGGNPQANLLFDTSMFGATVTVPPAITYNVDGVWGINQPLGTGTSTVIPVTLTTAGPHVLTVYISSTTQAYDRWGSVSQNNVARFTGLQVDGNAAAGTATFGSKWAIFYGDSITEGIAAALFSGMSADNLEDYSFFLGQWLQTQGYEYAVNGDGASGWTFGGYGNVPGLYNVAGNSGYTGAYTDATSRWNKIDAAHSLLDTNGHISAYGGTGQEPGLVFVNLGANVDASFNTRQSLHDFFAAERSGAPNAYLFDLVPFGYQSRADLQSGFARYQSDYPNDIRVQQIDLGATLANNLSGTFWGGLHPNVIGHGAIATQLAAILQNKFNSISHPKGSRPTYKGGH